MGPSADDVLMTFELAEGDKVKYDVMKAKFDKYLRKS